MTIDWFPSFSIFGCAKTHFVYFTSAMFGSPLSPIMQPIALSLVGSSRREKPLSISGWTAFAPALGHWQSTNQIYILVCPENMPSCADSVLKASTSSTFSDSQQVLHHIRAYLERLGFARTERGKMDAFGADGEDRMCPSEPSLRKGGVLVSQVWVVPCFGDNSSCSSG